MFVHTDTAECPWYVVESDDKRRARVNMIAHLLSTLPYYEVEPPAFQLPARPASTGYHAPTCADLRPQPRGIAALSTKSCTGAADRPVRSTSFEPASAPAERGTWTAERR
ncbi:polyphosphate kinase 2 PPK2 [Saccharothrix carnea]|uniref:Polyphosphate kinase 2 PPK2 n=1 Tax=Saccharothrix carnea TaxID=1280637 RepID=A0A2P8IFV0_SACCR|nr:polyphosphate kinase 2 PPK2 [Saccharothrix carnea]